MSDPGGALRPGFPLPGSWEWRPPQPWGGRVDDPEDPLALRWHEVVGLWDGAPPASSPGRPRVWLIGAATDIGVGRNKGRRGAAEGPQAIRRSLANLPRHFGEALELVDAGDLLPAGEDLEGLTEGLAGLVAAVVAAGGFPIVLGGGHEVAYGTQEGLRRGLQARGASSGAPRILSFDAHFDLRPAGPPEAPLSSGNMFRLIARDCGERGEAFEYGVIGIQRSANTPSLFEVARALGVDYLLARDIEGFEALSGFLECWLERAGPVHASLCTDVIDAAHAPGVSAPQPFGLKPELVLEGLRLLARSGRVAGLSVAEVAPRFPGDQGTAQLVAILLFAWVNALAGLE